MLACYHQLLIVYQYGEQKRPGSKVTGILFIIIANIFLAFDRTQNHFFEMGSYLWN